MGYLDEQVHHMLERLATFRLVETPEGYFREIHEKSASDTPGLHFRVTTVGTYHVQHWMTTFGFLDAMSIDTPIFDPRTLDAISSVATSFEIGDRLRRAELFRTYLFAQWNASGLGGNYLNFGELADRQQQSFEAVRAAATRPRTKRRGR